ncbi:MAG TPA: hypothetical protein DER09_11955 [Prolixibacteraceae bacterium]|nr:hypothetical protein [Prolixibacteraceae bacterium]
MHTEILSSAQSELLPWLKSFNRKFFLVGGTAIALHIGHRQSIDFDLFCAKPFQKSYVNGFLTKFPFKKNRLSEDVNQMHFIINGVKVTFFHFPFIIEHRNKIKDIITLPDLLTLAAMKAYALGRRAKWKDYVDLYFLLRDHFTFNEIAAEARKCFGDLFNERLFREQLSYHADINYSEPVEYLVPVPPDDEIKQFLIDKALDISF